MATSIKEQQKKVMPLVVELQRQIKILILFYAVHLLAKQNLLFKIQKLIKTFDSKLPNDLIDRESYSKSIYSSALLMINKTFVPIVNQFKPIENIRKPIDLFYKQKATPNVESYSKKVLNAMKHLEDSELATHEKGKKPISLWQKTELDIRHGNQMEKVQKAVDSGNDLFWLSSHPDCSERCEKWQGKLVSMSLKSIDRSMFTGKRINGTKIYSFTDIENIVDKYGYKNNIINGFNCRHHLIAYNNESSVPPEKYNVDEVKKERAINTKLREFERQIRRAKDAVAIYKVANDKKSVAKYQKKVKYLISKYKVYANSNGYAWLEYRI